MRRLKDGTIKYKPSAIKAAEWYQQAPLPMKSLPKRAFVKVFMGASWSKGQVVQWTQEGISVWLLREQRTVVVRDNRNIRKEES